MSMSRKQLALLHVAKSQLNLADHEYRAALVQIAGVASSKDLDQPGFSALMGFFEYLGFQPLVTSGPDFGNRPGMASFAQLELIRQLWREWSGSSIDDGLNTWLKNSFKVDSLRFLRAKDAQRVITALKSMKARAS
jgi:hypothetical protein